MTITLGGFVLEVGVWLLYVRVPTVGELCWSPQDGLVTSAAVRRPR